MPLRGDEIRACWEAGTAALESQPTTGARPPMVRADDPDDRTPVRRLEFVEVRSTPVEVGPPPASARPAPAEARPTPAAARRASRRAKVSDPAAGGTAASGAVPGAPGASVMPTWSLWGDADT